MECGGIILADGSLNDDVGGGIECVGVFIGKSVYRVAEVGLAGVLFPICHHFGISGLIPLCGGKQAKHVVVGARTGPACKGCNGTCHEKTNDDKFFHIR